MVMPRWSWSLGAAVSFMLMPHAAPPSVAALQRTELIPDTSFRLSDSVRAVLTAVTRVVVAPDSTVYLSDWQFPAIIQVDRSGEYQRALGRPGAGPGEFHQVYSIGLHGDSIWASDPAQVRLTLFPLSGAGSQTIPYGPYAPISQAQGAYSRRGLPASVLPDGSLLLQEGSPDPARPTTGWLLRADRTMRVVDTVTALPMGHTSLVFEYRDGGIYAVQPFSDDLTYSVSMDGSLVVLVTRPIATSEEEGEFTVTGLRNGSEPLFRRVIKYQPRRLSPRMVDHVVDSLAAFKPQGMSRSPIPADTIRNRMFKPVFYPPVREVKVGRDGSVWLKVMFGDGPSGADEWLQLSPRGFPQRRVTTPVGFRLLEGDRRAVWGAFSDSMDIPQVGRYRLDRVANN